MNRPKLLRLAAVVGPGAIAAMFETIRHAYLEHWLPHAVGNVATGVLVVGASSLLLVQIFRRLDKWETEARRAKARHAALQERERIAADLHDYVSQSLFYMNVVLGAAERDLGKGEVAAATATVKETRRVVGQLYDRIRRTIFDLKMPGDEAVGDFTELVQRIVHQFSRRSGVAVDITELSHRCGDDCPAAELELLRILQEALNNAARHADPQRIVVAVGADRGREWLTVTDDGRGFDVAEAPGIEEGHFGLAFMRQRAEHLGGTLSVESRVGAGTTVQFERRRAAEVAL